MVQSNLPSRSAYIIIQYTYLEGIFSLKSRMGRQDKKTKLMFCLERAPINVSQKII